MSLFNPVTDKVVSNNEVYTQECKSIYDNLHFAKVSEIKLWHEMLYWADGFFAVLILVILGSYTIPSFIIGRRDLAVDILSTCLLVIFTCIIVVSAVLCKKSYNNKRREFYFIKLGEDEYKFETVDVDGKLYIKYIAHINKRKGLDLENDKCKIYSWGEKGGLDEEIGFYQYLVKPTRVFPKAKWKPYHRGHSRYLYKKKKVKGNKVYYVFRSFGGVVGVRYARCIKLQNGVVKYVSEQITNGTHYYNSNGSHLVYNSYKYTYDYVNDGSVKIYIPSYAVEFAKKNKFILPLQSENLVVED